MIDPRKWKPAFGYGYINWPKQTPLEIRLVGKLYHHHSFCSGNLRGPMGSPGCCCLRWLREGMGP